MYLGDLVGILRNILIHIMVKDSETYYRTLYEGNSKFFRIEEYEKILHVLYIAPHRENNGELFILCEE